MPTVATRANAVRHRRRFAAGVAAAAIAVPLLGACNPVGLSNGWYPSGGSIGGAGCHIYKDKNGRSYKACQRVAPTPAVSAAAGR